MKNAIAIIVLIIFFGTALVLIIGALIQNMTLPQFLLGVGFFAFIVLLFWSLDRVSKMLKP